jgi:predicted CoA-binding protein
MTQKKLVDEFLKQGKFAIVGVSRNHKKFGYLVYTDLKKKGYNVFPVNPNTETIDDDKCFQSVSALPDDVKQLFVVTPKNETEQIIREAVQRGITLVWIQQFSESEEAVKLAESHNLKLIRNECILMFAEPVGTFHRLHRFVNKIIGRYPKN